MRQVYIPEIRSPLGVEKGPGVIQSLSGTTMGTGWTCKFMADTESRVDSGLRAGLERQFQLVIAQMSNWEPESDVSRFNRAPGGTWHQLAPEFFQVLSCAMRVAEESGGTYDPTVGPAVDLWGFGPAGGPGPELPAKSAIARVRRRVGWRRLRFDADRRRVYQPGGVALDLSSIAKGFAVDLAAGHLDSCGVRSYLMEIGGELKGRGVKPDGQPWWVELEGGDPPAVVALHELAVATSGEYRRNFLHAGRIYGHTIDPRTCRPIANPAWLAVSVLHGSCMAADAYATAAMVLGRGAARLGIAARLLPVDGNEAVETQALRAMLR